jgi:peptidase E
MTKKFKLRQIVAVGGGGGGSFVNTPSDRMLDEYILQLTRKRRPKICFLATASGDSSDYLARFHKAFNRRAHVSIVLLFRRTPIDPAAHLLAQDIIYVGGGNTANMLAVWRVHGIDRVLRTAWRRGIILCGTSAGMICWFECSVTDSFGALGPLRDGLGLLPGSACPHYDGESNRRPTFHRLIGGGFPAGVAADDGAAAHFVGQKIFRCISSRRGARVYIVSKLRGKVVEERLPTTYLEAHPKAT